MPATFTYPGVYIEELSSGVHTITGVATSITAFVGWAPQGPVDKAYLVLSWADYVRNFGGLHAESLLGYSVYQFFANGGQKAYIVRLTAPTAKAAFHKLGDLTITAKNPGIWANQYGVSIKQRDDAKDRFKLSVIQVQKGVEVVVESFENLSANPNDSRYVKEVVNPGSSIIAVDLAQGANTPANTGAVTPKAPTPSPRLEKGEDGDVLRPNEPGFQAALLDAKNGVGGVNLLDRIDIFNLLCVPGETDPTTLQTLQTFCRQRRAFLIADCAEDATFDSLQKGPDGEVTQDDAINAAFYFPWLKAPDPLDESRISDFPPCGFVAGVYAKTDVNRGVWKAPAGTEASLTGVKGVKETLTDLENGELNIRGINCIRTLGVYGSVIWGARTLQGNDERGSEWKYVPVRRMALFIEETLYRGTKWVVFEPNDEPLWAQIRLNVGAFMHDLFRQHAFQGQTPTEAYFVKCDKETTTQSDIDHGIVNILVGFAPLKPAEFVVIKIQQMAGQIET